MQLQPGSRLGPYEIVALIGAGGMGEVYRGRDTRLDRDVAIKILPQALSTNPALRQRFEREARAISSLSHPNVCTLYDIGEQDGIDFLVMEHLEGETLASRLASGPLPLDQVLRRGIEIADALDKAHRHGVIHRDLKPGNIMLTKSGAKLLDFGLAKIAEQSEASAAGVTNLPTEQRALTAEGTILGTFQYMAPEQLEGSDADARTDIFALGAVLYEMTTGKRAFDGKTKTSLIAAIVDRDPPPISSMQPTTPPALERLVKTCLAKDPDERWQSAHDVASELRWIADAGSQAGVATHVAARRRKREGLWIGIALAMALVAALLAVPFVRSRLEKPQPLYASIVPPKGARFDIITDDAGALSLSPDGRYITFSATADDRRSLWLRDLSQPNARRIEGTDGGTYPFWSPDSRWIAFFSAGKLKKVDVSGGPAVTIANAPNGRGGSWGKDDVIVFEPYWRDALVKVSAKGGKAEPVTKLDESKVETTHRYPWFLPDGKHFLFLAGSHKTESDSDLNAIYAGSVDSPERKLILSARANVLYVSGYLFFIREKYLMAQPFDVDALELKGKPERIAEDIAYASGYFRGVFAASENGVLAYMTGSAEPRRRLVAFDRQGKEIGALGDVDEFYDVRFSPDGSRMAVGIGDPPDLWIVDAKRGTKSRFTSERMSEEAPVWAPDSSRIVFASDRKIGADLYEKSLDGMTGEQPLLVHESDTFASDWSPDGAFLAFDKVDANDDSIVDIWILPMRGERKPFPFAATEFAEWGGVFSPDGRKVAFVSNESGRPEAYMAPFPGPGARRQLTTSGCVEVTWRRDGKELFCLSSDRSVMSISVNGEDFGNPQLLFRFAEGIGGDVAPDGQSFVRVVPEPTPADMSITLVRNWRAAVDASD